MAAETSTKSQSKSNVIVKIATKTDAPPPVPPKLKSKIVVPPITSKTSPRPSPKTTPINIPIEKSVEISKKSSVTEIPRSLSTTVGVESSGRKSTSSASSRKSTGTPAKSFAPEQTSSELKPSTHHKKRMSLADYQYLKTLTAQEAELKVQETCPPLPPLPDITIHKKPPVETTTTDVIEVADSPPPTETTMASSHLELKPTISIKSTEFSKTTPLEILRNRYKLLIPTPQQMAEIYPRQAAAGTPFTPRQVSNYMDLIHPEVSSRLAQAEKDFELLQQTRAEAERKEKERIEKLTTKIPSVEQVELELEEQRLQEATERRKILEAQGFVVERTKEEEKVHQKMQKELEKQQKEQEKMQKEMELQRDAINMQLIETMKKKYGVPQWPPVEKTILTKSSKTSVTNLFATPSVSLIPPVTFTTSLTTTPAAVLTTITNTATATSMTLPVIYPISTTNPSINLPTSTILEQVPIDKTTTSSPVPPPRTGKLASSQIGMNAQQEPPPPSSPK